MQTLSVRSVGKRLAICGDKEEAECSNNWMSSERSLGGLQYMVKRVYVYAHGRGLPQKGRH